MDYILDFIKNITIIGIVAILGLTTSIVALVWNIIRDLVMNRTKLSVKVKFGGIIRIRNTEKGLFIKKNSTPNKKIKNERILFSIVNSGRKPIMIEEVGAKLTVLRKKVKAKQIHVVSDKLPKMLHPYEMFNTDTKKIKEIYTYLKEGNIKYFFARDTKGKYWKNSRKNTKELLNDLKNGPKQ